MQDCQPPCVPDVAVGVSLVGEMAPICSLRVIVDAVIFRRAVAEDILALASLEQDGGVLGLSHIFPQDRYPVPQEGIIRGWQAEIDDPATHVYACTDERGALTGFAATRGNELLHFGTAPHTWGSGLASDLHNAVIATFVETTESPLVRLRVFEENIRARQFYEKHGWRATGQSSFASFPPHPKLIEYDRVINCS